VSAPLWTDRRYFDGEYERRQLAVLTLMLHQNDTAARSDSPGSGRGDHKRMQRREHDAILDAARRVGKRFKLPASLQRSAQLLYARR